MPVGERALVGVRRQVASQPGLLSRARATRDVPAVGVERDEVPGANVVAVVALPAGTGHAVRRSRAVEVVEVACGARRPILMIADGGMHGRLEAPPRRIEV